MTETSQSAGARAYEDIKERIVDGRFRGGQLLSEARVGEGLGISRTPVHEALMRLEQEGLVSLLSRRGVLVATMPIDEARNVIAMRIAIEESTMRSIVGSGCQEGLRSELRANLERQRSAVSAHDVDAFVTEDDDFHSLVITGAGNPIAERFWSMLRDRQQRLRHQSLQLHPGLLPDLLEEHEALQSALIKGDESTYREVLNQHAHRHEIDLNSAPKSAPRRSRF